VNRTRSGEGARWRRGSNTLRIFAILRTGKAFRAEKRINGLIGGVDRRPHILTASLPMITSAVGKPTADPIPR
jgi:hypothetical protein